MLNVLVIEDEAPALARLCRLLTEVAPTARLAGKARSVREARAWLSANPTPNLIVADIQLGDGLSLEIFQDAAPTCPVIFVTAHDEYLLEAFASHGIAYLLKPVKSAELAQALQKYRELGRHFTANFSALTERLIGGQRQRIIAQKGRESLPVALERAAYFYSEDKLTFVVTAQGERLLVNQSLAELEGVLDASAFFRVNRNFLANINAVQSFSSIGKGRLALQLKPAPSEEVQVSQERAADFRAWIGR